MRIDKFLTDVGLGSRKEVKQLLKKKVIVVNKEIVQDGKRQIDEENDCVIFEGERLVYQKYYYYMLNKPQGVISATKDSKEKTVVDLMKISDQKKGLFPVGRLDKDTEGLLLLTNNGPLAHELLSPKKHIDKEYFAIIQGIVSEKEQEYFAKGFELSKTEKVKPSRLSIDSINKEENRSTIHLIIQEGKFHQVKRMFEKVGKRVLYLKRLRMGSLILDEKLSLGEYRQLTIEETKQLLDHRQ